MNRIESNPRGRNCDIVVLVVIYSSSPQLRRGWMDDGEASAWEDHEDMPKDLVVVKVTSIPADDAKQTKSEKTTITTTTTTLNAFVVVVASCGSRRNKRTHSRHDEGRRRVLPEEDDDDEERSFCCCCCCCAGDNRLSIIPDEDVRRIRHESRDDHAERHCVAVANVVVVSNAVAVAVAVELDVMIGYLSFLRKTKRANESTVFLLQ